MAKVQRKRIDGRLHYWDEESQEWRPSYRGKDLQESITTSYKDTLKLGADIASRPHRAVIEGAKKQNKAIFNFYNDRRKDLLRLVGIGEKPEPRVTANPLPESKTTSEKNTTSKTVQIFNRQFYTDADGREVPVSESGSKKGSAVRRIQGDLLEAGFSQDELDTLAARHRLWKTNREEYEKQKEAFKLS